MPFHVEDTNLPVDRTIAPGDTMIVPGREQQYWQIGQRALDLVRFSADLCDKPHYPDILDLGCGYGRVMRWIRANYNYARITACDIERDAVDFCVKHFGALPAYAGTDPRALPFAEQFDLTWVGSVFTHLPPEKWQHTLECVVKWTRPCGVIIMSTQGRYFTTWLKRGQPYIADNIDKAALIAEFERTGFGYQPYRDVADGGYGITVTSPEWLARTIQRHPNLIIRGYFEQVWGMQDVIILYKADNYFEPL
jgi:SAM-dependent methyltransferase